jgi:hypothetical protein
MEESGLGVEELDTILRPPQRRQHHHNHHPVDEYNDEPLIEITSAGSAAGKTELLYLITAATILPPTRANDAAAGQHAAGAVVVLDVDGRFDSRRLYTVATALLKHRRAASRPAPPPPPEHVDARDQADDPLRPVVLEALRHAHIFRPTTLADTLTILAALPAYLLGPAPADPSTARAPPRHFSADRALRAILLDGAGPLYWAARAASSSSSAAGPSGGTASAADGKQHPPFSALGAALRGAARALECPAVVVTTRPLAKPPPPPPPPAPPPGRSPAYPRRRRRDERRADDRAVGEAPAMATTFPAARPGAAAAARRRLSVRRVPVRAFAPGPAGAVARARELGGVRAGVVERHEFVVERVDDDPGDGEKEWRFAVGEHGVRWGRGLSEMRPVSDGPA